jgi:hypothetical protein
MARGTKLEVRSAGAVIARPSLAGAAAAMRYMDARQGRAGTMAALVATGPLGASAVRPAPAFPSIRRARVPAGAAPVTLWREELAALGKFTACADEMRDASPPELYRLSKSETLVLVPCGAGAYNFSAVPVIATGIPGRRSFRFAAFDYQPGWSQDAGIPCWSTRHGRRKARRLRATPRAGASAIAAAANPTSGTARASGCWKRAPWENAGARGIGSPSGRPRSWTERTA